MLVLLKDCKNYDKIITLMTINKHLPQPADVHARRVEVRPRHLWNPCGLPLHPHGHCRSGLDFVKTQIQVKIQREIQENNHKIQQLYSTPSAHFSPIIIFFFFFKRSYFVFPFFQGHCCCSSDYNYMTVVCTESL